MKNNIAETKNTDAHELAGELDPELEAYFAERNAEALAYQDDAEMVAEAFPY